MQAYLSLTYGNSISKGIGDWHEYVEGKNSPRGEFDMDLWNNKIGREIAKEIRQESMHRLIKKSDANDLIAEKIMKKMKNGELITKPGQKPKIPKNGFDFNKEYTSLEELKRPQHERINKVHEMFQKHEEKLKGKKTNSTSGGNGRWVTMNGRHVYLAG